ncbi:hypothetical protein, partial [Serratia marcescens]|uniref:hypothetical protein n=1 Tax=Serratia marcescens TaxID=615 RepID=UPI0021CCF84C
PAIYPPSAMMTLRLHTVWFSWAECGYVTATGFECLFEQQRLKGYQLQTLRVGDRGVFGDRAVYFLNGSVLLVR